MKALNGKARPRPGPRSLETQRKGLLAKVHIAKKALGLSDAIYEDILIANCGKPSAAYCTVVQLEELIRYFQHLGWKPTKSRRQRTDGRGQIEALRERAGEIALDLENGEKRLNALVEKICEVERVEWCRNVRKLKRLVAVLEKIRCADADDRRRMTEDG